VFLARSDDAGSFAAPVRVNDIAGDAAPHEQAPAQVAVAPDGSVYVLWQNNTIIPGRRFPASDLRLARSTDGGHTFEPAIFVNDDAHETPTSHTFHDIAVSADCTVYVSWIDGRERARAELARTQAGESHDNSGATSHAMHDPTLPGSQIRLATSTDGGQTFGPSVVVYDNACPCCRTSLVVGDAGAVFIGFRSAANNIRDVVIARSTDGGASFGDAVRVHPDEWSLDGCPHAGPALALDAAGALHVAWYTGAPERQGIWHASSHDDGVTFSAPTALLAGGWVPVSQVKLASDAAGTVWAAWDDRRNEQPVVQLASISHGDAPRTIPIDAAGQSPDIAAGRSITLTWHAENAARALRLERER
jgi:hypothetical protein